MDRHGSPVTDAAIAQFEQLIGATLPDDYRAFLLEVNGGRTSRSHRRFQLRKHDSILNSLHSLDDADEQHDLATRQQYPKNDIPKFALKIGYDDGGSSVVLILSGPHRGEVWYLDRVDPRPEGSNPRVEWSERRDVSKLANTFREFMDGLKPLDAVKNTKT